MAKFNVDKANNDILAADKILSHLKHALVACNSHMTGIIQAVEDGGGKSAVVASLGSRAADVQSAYDDLKTFVTTWSSLTPDDL